MVKIKCPKCSWQNNSSEVECVNCGFNFLENAYNNTSVDIETLNANLADIRIFATPILDGLKVEKYLGVVSYEVIFGSNILKDIFAGITDIVGGRSLTYENTFREAKQLAIQNIRQQCYEYNGNAIIGLQIKYLTISEYKMLMCYVSGEAVVMGS